MRLLLIMLLLAGLTGCRSKPKASDFTETLPKSTEVILESKEATKSVESAKTILKEAIPLIKEPIPKEKVKIAEKLLAEAIPKMKNTTNVIINMNGIIQELKDEIVELEEAMYSGFKNFLRGIMGFSVLLIIGGIIGLYYSGRGATKFIVCGIAGLFVSTGLLFIWDAIVIVGATLCALSLIYGIYYAVTHFKDGRDELVDNYYNKDVKKLGKKVKKLVEDKHKE